MIDSTRITAQDFFNLEELPEDAVLAGPELSSAMWELRRMQREFQQQQVFWKALNASMSDAYSKLASFQELKTSKERLEEANAELEQRVAERTAALIEQIDRARAQEETIRALGAPIIRVWESVLVLPLIGQLDRARAADVMERLLDAMHGSGSAFAVLDLTGLRGADGETVAHLLRIGRAVGLLGARCLLSGLSGAIAAELAALGEGLGDLLSFQSLHAALQYALPRVSAGAAPRRDP